MLVVFSVLLSTVGFSMGSGPDLGDNQYEVTGVGRSTGPRGGLACRSAENQAESNLVSNCSAMGVGARLIDSDDARCSCTSWNDRNFEDCTATAWGVCEVN